MGSGQVIEAFPFGQSCLQIDVVGVSQQLIELFGVGSMRAFDLAIELRRIWFDIGVSDTLVLNMPVEFGLELMAVVSTNLTDPEWNLAVT